MLGCHPGYSECGRTVHRKGVNERITVNDLSAVTNFCVWMLHHRHLLQSKCYLFIRLFRQINREIGLMDQVKSTMSINHDYPLSHFFSFVFFVCIHFLLQSLSLHNTFRFSLNPPTVLLRFLRLLFPFLDRFSRFPSSALFRIFILAGESGNEASLMTHTS